MATPPILSDKHTTSPSVFVWWCRLTPTDSDRGHAAVDWEAHACDEACFVGSEEQGGRRDLLRAAYPPERDGRGELRAGLVGPLFGRRLLLEDRRVDRAPSYRLGPGSAILQR